MADEPERPTNDTPPAQPGAAGVLEEEEDFLFQARMKVVDLFLGYWRHALTLAALSLVVVGLYGVWRDQQISVQQGIHAQIAKIEASLPEDQAALATVDWRTMGQRVQSVAEDATGVGETYAWIQAAQMYELGDFHDDALPAWEAAHQTSARGILGWSAASGYATALARADRTSEAEVIFRSWADKDSGAIGEQALYALGSLFRDAGRKPESTQVFQEFLQRYPESPLAPVVQQAIQELQGS